MRHQPPSCHAQPSSLQSPSPFSSFLEPCLISYPGSAPAPSLLHQLRLQLTHSWLERYKGILLQASHATRRLRLRRFTIPYIHVRHPLLHFLLLLLPLVPKLRFKHTQPGDFAFSPRAGMSRRRRSAERSATCRMNSQGVSIRLNTRETFLPVARPMA